MQQEYRLLRRFWESTSVYEILDALQTRLELRTQSKSLETIQHVQTKLEWFEALTIGFYVVEVTHVFLNLYAGGRHAGDATPSYPHILFSCFP